LWLLYDMASCKPLEERAGSGSFFVSTCLGPEKNHYFGKFFVASAACPDPAVAAEPPVSRPVLVARKRGLNSLGSPAGDSAFDRQVDTTLPSLPEHRNQRQESCASRPGSSESEDYRDDSYEAQCDHCVSSEEEEDDRDEQEQDRDEQEKEDRDEQEEDRDEQEEEEESNDDTAEEQESDDEKQQASSVNEQESVKGKLATSAEEQVSNVETRRIYWWRVQSSSRMVGTVHFNASS
jgi:flagellar biosynthesis GTPase FlhF